MWFIFKRGSTVNRFKLHYLMEFIYWFSCSLESIKRVKSLNSSTLFNCKLKREPVHGALPDVVNIALQGMGNDLQPTGSFKLFVTECIKLVTSSSYSTQMVQFKFEIGLA